MPLSLTTPKSTGDLDPNSSSYSYVKIIRTTHNPFSRQISVLCQYGNQDGEGNWTAGIVPSEPQHIEGDDYDALLTETPNEGETAYQAVSRVLYEWLVDQEIYIGTYV